MMLKRSIYKTKKRTKQKIESLKRMYFLVCDSFIHVHQHTILQVCVPLNVLGFFLSASDYKYDLMDLWLWVNMIE